MKAAPQSIGFIGLGNAGWGMASALAAAGHDIVVWDRDAERTSDFIAEYGVRDGTAPERFGDVKTLFTMLPHGEVVREVLLATPRVATHLRPGTVVVDTSSSDPIGTRKLAAELATRNIVLIDSGVSEARVGDAALGAITFIVGADDDTVFERVRPLLEVMGARIVRVGRTGAGHATKTLNNYVSATGLHAALDSLIAGHRYGLDLATMIDVFNVSTARNLSTEGTMRNKALPRRFTRRYSLGMLAKDMSIAASLARATAFESELFGLLERAFAAARDDVGFDEDLTAALLHWEHRAGVELPATEPNSELAEVRRRGTASSTANTGPIGFVGLGSTGGAVAAHLVAAGHRLVVHDGDPSRAVRFGFEHGCEVAATAVDLHGVDVLFLAVPGEDATRQLLLAPEALAGRLDPATVVVACHSMVPSATRRLADDLAALGIPLVDVGISFSDLGAIRAGRMNLMVGADDDAALTRALGVLETISAHIFRTGGTGTGHAVSLLNDYVAAAGLRGALDALIVGYRYQLDPARMLDAFNVSTGRNFSTEQTLRLEALPRTFDTGYSLSAVVDAATNALAFARELDLNTELVELVHRDLSAALHALGDGDVATVLRHWECESGTALPRTPAQGMGAHT